MPFSPQPKGVSRLEQKILRERAEFLQREHWKRAVWDRDEGKCRSCGVRCVKVRELHPRRGECHHVEPRANRATRWNLRNGLLVCAGCHQRITGAVNDKLVIQGDHYFTVGGQRYLDASWPVRFMEVLR